MQNIPKLISFLLGLIPFAINAQTVPTLWLHGLEEDDRLTVGNVINIFQDTEGFTWIGAEKGLYRFDGRTVKKYPSNLNDSTSLKDNLVNGGFFEDSKANIWFCTNTAIHCYHRKSDNFKRYHLEKKGLRIENAYQAIYLEKDSFLWLRAGNNELFRFDIHKHTQSKVLGKTQLDIGLFPGVDREGALKYLFSTDGSDSIGLEVIEIFQDSLLHSPQMHFDGSDPDQPALNVFTVLYEENASIWLSTQLGIVKWDGLENSNLDFFTIGRNAGKSIRQIDAKSILVLDFDVGLFLFNKKEGTFSKIETKLITDQKFNLNKSLGTPYIDPQGNWWFSLNQEGLVYTNTNKLKVNSIPKMKLFNGADNYRYRTFLQDAEENVWLSTLFDGIFLVDKDGNKLKHYHPMNPQSNSLFSKQAYHIMLDDAENLWVGTAKGVAMKAAGQAEFKQVFDVEGKPVPYVLYFYQLKSGEILASTIQRGIYQIFSEKGEWKLKQIYTTQADSEHFESIYEDNSGSIYISHKMVEVHVFSFADSKLKKLAELPIAGFINGFHEDRNGQSLWIATSAGLVELDKTDLSIPPKIYTEEHGLVSKQLQSMVSDKGGNLWLGTNKGLVRFNPLDTVFHHFSLADGTQSGLFYEYAALEHTDGSFWFGGNNGVTIVRPEEIDFLKNDPIVQLTNIKINDELPTDLAGDLTNATNVSLLKQIKRDYEENTLTFEFVAIDYSDPKATQLEYKMEGIEENWVRLQKGESGFVRYLKLPPDTYTFKVRAANSDGIWSKEKTLLKITITPPWWQTWWACALYVLIVGGAIYGIYRIRIAQIRKDEALKRKEAEFKQLAAETETAVLRLQMNPHFIFNSMNSINSYILQKDVRTASDYLNRFAKLMRMILKFAAKPMIAVSDEVDLLELYLQTEAMRFEKQFAYSFDLPEDMDPDDFVIPTMILQPFVENAIWHGLSKKKGEGHIKISFREENESLICSVEDNGVGRAASNHKAKTHESKAMSITGRRLQLLKPENGVSATFEIHDLVDAAKQPAGTKVVLRLPLL